MIRQIIPRNWQKHDTMPHVFSVFMQGKNKNFTMLILLLHFKNRYLNLRQETIFYAAGKYDWSGFGHGLDYLF